MNVDGSLTRIGRATATDKATFHGFTPIYERHFHGLRNSPLKLLEVGVYEGSSMKMWEEYFLQADLYGVDITWGYLKHSFSDRVRLGLANQAAPEEMLRLFQTWKIAPESLDICIDDGGHRMSQQNRTIGICWPFLKSGGTFVIEDLHTAFPELIGVHSHLKQYAGHIDEHPTSIMRLQQTMLGVPEQFPGVPVGEVRYVSLYSHVPTKSFTCVVEKM